MSAKVYGNDFELMELMLWAHLWMEFFGGCFVVQQGYGKNDIHSKNLKLAYVLWRVG